MQNTAEDIEFIPSDEVEEETEVAGAEDDAVHPEDREQPRGLMIAEDEKFNAEQLDDDHADELQIQADEQTDEEAVEADEADEEHEEDLKEVLSRHYGIVEEEASDSPADDEKPRPLRPSEFVCQSCFLRKHRSQLSDPADAVCADCVADAA